jgi:hypothetical protein
LCALLIQQIITTLTIVPEARFREVLDAYLLFKHTPLFDVEYIKNQSVDYELNIKNTILKLIDNEVLLSTYLAAPDTYSLLFGCFTSETIFCFGYHIEFR